MKRLNGKVALITGSARGIGKQIALTFAGEGADIVVNDVRVKESELTAQEIRSLGRKALVCLADVSNKKEVTSMVQSALKEFGRIDILVNNAGVSGRELGGSTTILEMPEEQWDRVVDVDLKGVFLCTQAVAPHMIGRKYGKIVNISSMGGMGHAVMGSSNYASAKAGVIQMTKTHALELGPSGINVNCIAPGAIITEFTSIGRTQEQVEKYNEERRQKTAMRRLGNPTDVANLSLFLASDESSFICGETIRCDGGRFDRI